MYEQYLTLAEHETNAVLGDRLGEYRYIYDIDQVILTVPEMCAIYL